MRTSAGTGAARAVLIGIVLVALVLIGLIVGAVALLAAPVVDERPCIPGVTIGLAGCSAPAAAVMSRAAGGATP
jgi:hypothetical protein